MGKILVVDDSDSARSEICKYLEEAGHTTVSAGNGSLGLEAYKKETDLDLIVSDINMPVMDGITMSEEIQKVTDRKAPPIIIVTTESDKALKERGKKAGVLVWVIKPINPQNFVNVVGQIIEKFSK